MSDLLGCPFCGSDDHMVLQPTCDRNTPYDPNDRAFPIIRCMRCFIDVPGKDFDASGKTAIDHWNRRAPIPEAGNGDGSHPCKSNPVVSQETAILEGNGNEWLPIETAPKDGTHILGIVMGNHPVTRVPFIPEVCQWDEATGEWWNEMWADSIVENGGPYNPTHWRPLPPPPLSVLAI